MATGEYTEVHTLSGLSAGLTTNQYITLNGGLVGSYAIKNFSVMTTGGFDSGPPYAYQILTNDEATGAGICIYSDAAGVAADETAFVEANYNVLEPFIAFNVNMTAPGDVIILISYIFFPEDSVIAPTISSGTFTISGGGIGAVLGSIYATYPTIIKSICLSNYTNTEALEAEILFDGTAFDIAGSIAIGDFYIYDARPIYINEGQELSVNVTSGTAPLNVVYNYVGIPTT